MNMTPCLIVLGFALFFEGGQCQIQEVVVVEGSVAVLPCLDENPPLSHSAAVYWSRIVGNELKRVWRREKNGLVFRPIRDPIRANCPLNNFGKADYSLHIDGTTYEDAGEYICEVEGKNNKIVKAIMLRVMKVSFSPAVVFEGSETKAECVVSPWKQGARMNWIRNGQSMKRVNLVHVTQKDAGNWTCQFSYRSNVVEATVSLEVRGISSPKDDTSVLYATVGSSVTLPCVFTDGLMPNTESWTKTSSNPPFLLPISYNRSSATIDIVEEKSGGIYTCSGIMLGLNGNKMKVQRQMKLVVAQVLRSSSSSDGSETLTCHLGKFSQATSYEWLRVTYGPNDTPIVTSIQKTQSIRIEQVKDAVELVCRFYRDQELLGNVTYHLHVMDAVKGEKLSSSNKTGMVMGLGFLFLVVFLILFQMYRNYNRKKKILLYPAMETIVHQAASDREWRERREQTREKMVEACVGEPKSVCV